MTAARTLIDGLDASAAGDRGIRFIRGESEESFLPYSRLREEALLLLGGLQAAGLSPGDEAVFQLDDDRAFLTLFWACVLGGLVPVPLAVASSPDRRRKVLNVWKLLERPVLVGAAAQAARLAGELPGRRLAWEELGRREPGALRPASPGDLAFLQFSSGSTGDPKGVMLTHRNLATNTADLLQAAAATAGDSMLGWVPLTHDMGMVAMHLQALMGGLDQTILPTRLFVRRPSLWLAKASEHRATILFSPGFGYHHFLSAWKPEDAAGWDLSRVRLIYNGAEQISAPLCRRFLRTLAPYGLSEGCSYPGYGLAEASVGVATAPPGEPLRAHRVDRHSLAVGAQVRPAASPREEVELVDCGAPFAHCRVRVCDDADRPLAGGVVGSIQIQGENVTSGYYRNPEATAGLFTADGWLRTGDLGFLNGGRLVVTGRRKELLIVAGQNYYPQDLESLAEEVEGVGLGRAVACAVQRPDAGQEALVVFVQWKRPPAAFAPVAERVRERLLQAAGLDVEAVVPVPRIPRTTSGKVQRFRLAESYLQGELERPRELRGAGERPRGSVLELVQAEIRRVLGEGPIDPHRPLSEQGLDSPRALHLAGALSRAVGNDLPVSLAFDCPTAAAIACFLEGADETGRGAAPAAAEPGEPIAVLGFGCRFPGGADGPEELWRLLRDGVDAIREVPPERWDASRWHDPDPDAGGRIVTRYGGFLEEVDGFDHGFFAVSAPEAESLDPQQRLLLEVSWEALEHAGQAADRLRGSRTGVFVGICASDWAGRNLRSGDPARIDAWSLTGTALSAAAGRISYVHGFQGPCLSVDTACSSSLAAVHLAVQSLRGGESDLALAGGVSLILSPDVHVGFSRLRALSPDGRCKTFDAAADGYGRGEGCALVVLKRLADALADGDPVLAVIRGTAINQDGATNGLTAPSGAAQQEVIGLALRRAGLEPREVSYVEAHGSGTPLGDPQEMRALAAAYGRGRPASDPLLVGSVKTNLGHAEAAAGVAGLLKAVLALAREEIPPHLHLASPSPHIPWAEIPVRVPVERVPWPRGERPRRAGISAFGFSGTNAHVIVEEAPLREEPAPEEAGRALVLPISARSREALGRLLAGYRETLRDDLPDLPAFCRTAALRRAHHPWRAAAVGSSAAGLRAEISRLAEEGLPEPPAAWGNEPPATVFVFPGQGSQWVGMARGLLREEPAFQRALEECAEALAPHVGWDLLDELADGGSEGFLAAIDRVQPALFAVEVALAALWRSWGIEPRAVVGHSMGEVAAACVAGALSMEDAARVICRRSRLLRRVSGGGAMLSVELPMDEARGLLRGREDRIACAVSNSPGWTVLSGDPAALQEVAAELAARGLFCRPVKVDVASHSPQMDPLRADLLRELEGLAPRPARIPIFSTVTGGWLAGGELGAEYWADNLRRPVLFSGAVAALLAEGHRVFLETSPHPILVPAVEQCIAAAGRAEPAHAVGSLRRDAPERAEMLAGLARLYALGWPVDWTRLYGGPGRCVDLPRYPWQRRRFWIDEPQGAAKALPGAHPLLGEWRELAGEPFLAWEGTLGLRELPFLADHRVDGAAVMPAAAWIEMACAACRQAWGAPADLAEVEIREALALGDEAVRVQLKLADGPPGAFEIWSRPPGEGGWRLHVRGTALLPGAQDAAVAPPAQDPGAVHSSGEEHYRRLARLGLRYGPRFQAVREIWAGPRSSLARIAPDAGHASGVYGFHPALLDACLQALAPAAAAPGPWVPVAIRRVTWGCQPAGELWAAARWRTPDGRSLEGDLRVTGAAGEPVLEIAGIRLARLARTPAADPEESLYRLAWSPAPAAGEGSVESGLLLALTGEGERSARALSRLAAGGARCLKAPPGELARSLRGLPEAPVAVLCLWPLDGADGPDPEEVESDVSRLVQVVQDLAGAGASPRLVLVTRAAVAAGPGDPLVLPGQAALWGLARTIAEEHPELAVDRVDLPRDPAEEDLDRLAADWARHEPEAALRDGVWRIPALARVEPAPEPAERPAAGSPFAAFLDRPGDLSRLAFGPHVRRMPGPGEAEVEVEATGLNFMNVLSALGLYPGAPGGFRSLGIECSGRVARVGVGASGLAPGDAVFGLAENCLASHALARAELLARKPEGLSFAAAAGVPVAFLTAAWALLEVAGLKEGESVLIHSAAGGVGLAAVQLAGRLGAEVLATAGTEEKRELLRTLGIRHVFDSRSLDFGEGVLAATGGRGVDAVLNSLAGPALRRSLELLAPFGRFLEIGKRDLHGGGRLDLGLLRRSASFTAIDLDRLVAERPARLSRLLTWIAGRLAAGDLAPLPFEEAPVERAAETFARMAEGRHTGKLVLAPPRGEVRLAVSPPAPTVSADASYLLTGGYGALGLVCAEWLLARGAVAVALLGRGEPPAEAGDRIAALQRRHGPERLTLLRGDVADEESLREALDGLERRLPPLRGVLHAAGLLEDRALLHLDAGTCRRVLAPKVRGAWNLHRLTVDRDLDFFVLFSSVAGWLGSPGQGPYGAANAFLDGLAAWRRSRGLPALSIAWGPVAWIGLGAASAGRLAEEGFPPLLPAECLPLLTAALASELSQVAALHIGSPTRELPLLAGLAGTPEAAPARPALLERLAGLPSPVERLECLGGHLADELARVLRCPASTIADDAPFKALGLDSLLAIQASRRLGESLGIDLPVTTFWSYPTVREYRRFLAGRLGVAGPLETGPSASPVDIGTVDLSTLESLSEEEAEERLLAKLVHLPGSTLAAAAETEGRKE